jgi:hypothetical protein
MKMKYWSNVMNIIHSLSWSNFMDYDTHKTQLNNLFNPSMNNFESIDYANKDWTDDHDSLIPKHSQEFPRLSSKFNNRLKDPKPWGPKSEPIEYDQHNDATLELFEIQGAKYQKGVWHYSSIPYVDHLDLCGLPPFLSKFRVLLGMEYRPQFWFNLFNRLKTLDVTDQTH